MLKGASRPVIVHVPNSGSMLGVKDPQSRCWVTDSQNPKRKLQMTLEIVETARKTLVGVNTARTNDLVEEAFSNRLVPHWSEFDEVQREVKISKESRLDFLLTNKNKKHYVEVKNVSMALPPQAVFPDAVTERGQKHIKDLVSLLGKNQTAEVFFVVQREDCFEFRPCDEIDPEYGKLLRWAADKGLRVSAWKCKVTPDEITIATPIPVNLEQPSKPQELR